MNDWTTWLIIALFYAPLHFLLPALFLLIIGKADHRKQQLKMAMIDSGVSMVVVFGVALLLIPNHLMAALLVLLAGMCLPFLRIAFHQLHDRHHAGTER